MSIHNKFVGDLLNLLDSTEQKLQTALSEVKKARSYGDLSENAEYEIAHSTYLKLYAEKEKIMALLEEPVLYSKTSDIIEPGCIIALKVYGPFKEIDNSFKDSGSLREMSFGQPSETANVSVTANSMGSPNFSGILLFGGLPEIFDFSVGKTMNVNSQIGKSIKGKPSGRYEVQVPDGFVFVDVKKLKYYKSPDAAMSDTEYSIRRFYEEVGDDYGSKEEAPHYQVIPM